MTAAECKPKAVIWASFQVSPSVSAVSRACCHSPQAKGTCEVDGGSFANTDGDGLRSSNETRVFNNNNRGREDPFMKNTTTKKASHETLTPYIIKLGDWKPRLLLHLVAPLLTLPNPCNCGSDSKLRGANYHLPRSPSTGRPIPPVSAQPFPGPAESRSLIGTSSATKLVHLRRPGTKSRAPLVAL